MTNTTSICDLYNSIEKEHGPLTGVTITQLYIRHYIPDWFDDVAITDDLVRALYDYYVDGEVSQDFNNIYEMFNKIERYCYENDMSLTEFLYARGYLDYTEE